VINQVAHIEKIVSGGQTGANRAALDFPIQHGIPHGGWCPHGRKAEDGTTEPRYNLRAGGLLVAYSSWFRYALPHEQHA
jgi:hypothetical protein